jgi:hypothetical protein
MQGVGCRSRHTRKKLDSIEFAEVCLRQNLLNCIAQRFCVDRLRETAGETRGKLLERHDLNSVALATSGVEPDLTRREATMCYVGLPLHEMLPLVLIDTELRWRASRDQRHDS